MAVVYEAIQRPLGRHVALKVIPSSTCSRTLQSERFSREARAIARLKHPNIVTVHASGETDGFQYIAMDYIDGPSLESVLGSGPMEVERAATLVRAIAGALHAAHEAGFVHRDVKPSNVLLDREGNPHLTDFGLVHDPTDTRLTLAAAVLGTPAYMSPEQARGEDPVPAHDTYALGAVLYAILAGRPPYNGSLPSAVLSAVLMESPPKLRELRPDLPSGLAAICDRALSRVAQQRYASVAEFAADLGSFLEGRRTIAERQEISRTRRRVAAVVVAVVGAVAAIGSLIWMGNGEQREEAGGLGSILSSLRSLDRITAAAGLEMWPSLSPKGDKLVYASDMDGDWDLYLDRIGKLQPENLTEDSIAVDSEPAFSPDGTKVAFRSDRDGGGIFVLDLYSRYLRKVLEFGHHPTWSPDGGMLALSTEQVVGVGRSPRNLQSEIWTVDLTSGERQRLVTSDAVQPAWSPSGARIAFIGRRGDISGLWTMKASGSDVVLCAKEEALLKDPAWLASGSGLLFTSRIGGASEIRAILIDEESGACGGEQSLVLRSLSEAQQSAAVSRDGRYIALVSWKRNEGTVRASIGSASQVVTRPVTSDTRVESSPDLSPDGSWLALSVQDGPSDLVAVRTDNTDRRKLTEDNFEERTPRWAPDGKWIAFAANRTGNFEIWRMRPDGSDVERLTETAEGSALSPVWSPDGSRLAYGVRGQGILEIDPAAPAPRTPRVVLPASALQDPESVPRAWSPDGRRLLLVDRDRNATVLDLATGQETAVPGQAQGGAWTADGELWVTDGSDLRAIDSKTGETRVLASVAPRKFSAALSIDRRTGDAYTTVVENEADIWLMDLTGAGAVGAPGAPGR